MFYSVIALINFKYSMMKIEDLRHKLILLRYNGLLADCLHCID